MQRVATNAVADCPAETSAGAHFCLHVRMLRNTAVGECLLPRPARVTQFREALLLFTCRAARRPRAVSARRRPHGTLREAARVPAAAACRDRRCCPWAGPPRAGRPGARGARA